MSPSSPTPPSTVGPYTIVRVLGRGGAGLVYEARLGRDGPTVALKVLAPDLARDPELVARVRREGRALARLSHPGIVRVEDLGEIGGSPYIALELLPGGTLADRLKTSGRLPWREALTLAALVARALAHVHEAGLVHRDVKPANVFVDAAGKPRLGDFGLVRPSADSMKGLTRSGESLGTPEYLAPEQIDRARDVDFRADLYSLGAMLHMLLTGSTPFEGQSGAGLLYAKLKKAPPSVRALVPEVPEPVAALVLRLQEREPGARAPDALTLASELEQLVRSGGKSARSRRGPRAAGLVAALLGLGAAVIVAAVLVVVCSGKAPPEVVAPSPPVASPSSPVVAATPKPHRPSPSPRPLSEVDVERALQACSTANTLLVTSKGGAEVEILKLLDGQPPLAEVREVRGRLYLKRIGQVSKADAPDMRERALEEFRGSIAAVPTYGLAWLGLSRALEPLHPMPTIEELEPSLAAVRRATEVAPLLADAWHDYVWTLRRTNREPEAVEAAWRGIQLNPESSPLWAVLAAMYVRTHEKRAAEAVAAESVRLDGTNANGLEYLARTRLALGRPGDALAPARRTIDLRPGAGAGYLYLGLAEIRMGALDPGLIVLKVALEKTPIEYDEQILQLVDAFIEAGERDLASKTLTKYVTYVEATSEPDHLHGDIEKRRARIEGMPR